MRGVVFGSSLQVHRQFPGLCHIELQVVQLTTCYKVIGDSPELSLIPSTDTFKYDRIIREHLKVTDSRGLWCRW